MQVGRTLYVGRSGRTNQTAINELGALLAPWGYRVEGVDFDGCLHLKTACTFVPPHYVLANPDWVDPRVFAGLTSVAVADDEPFAANTLTLGGVTLVPSQCPRTAALLRARGVITRDVDLSELAKAEGALTCSSLIRGCVAARLTATSAPDGSARSRRRISTQPNLRVRRYGTPARSFVSWYTRGALCHRQPSAPSAAATKCEAARNRHARAGDISLDRSALPVSRRDDARACPQSRREFCVSACHAATAVALGSVLQSCGGGGSSAGPGGGGGGGGSPLAGHQRDGRGRRRNGECRTGTALAPVGGAALVRSAAGDFLVAHTAQVTFTALTAICTHEACTITGFRSPTYVCPCHGSQYNTAGPGLERSGDPVPADLPDAADRHHTHHHDLMRDLHSVHAPGACRRPRGCADDRVAGIVVGERAVGGLAHHLG